VTRYLASVLVVVMLLPAALVDGAPPDSVPRYASLVPVEGSKRDAASGLPTRVFHEASGIVLVLIPAGEFEMGSPETEPDRSKRERLHRRVIRKPFYLGETEVTVGQFRRFVRASGYETDAERGTPDHDNVGPGSFATTPDGERTWTTTANWRNPFPILKDFELREDHPVVHVTWNDAQRFVAHFGLRLPSEAQWEYAARAGSRERFPWGESEAGGRGFANVGDEARRRRFESTNVFFPFDDGAALLSPVGRYKPNAWGLRDMIGKRRRVVP
jgi:sulfatase modifying factor 1